MNRRKQLRPIILDELEEWTQQYLTPSSIVSSNIDMTTTQSTNTSLRTQSVSSRSSVQHTDTSKNTCLLPAYIPQLPSWSTQQLNHTIPDSQPSTEKLQGKMYELYHHEDELSS
ncbi:hypothetical protein V865_006465 [Kwoniella europaea PYCC6329]|uniref:Uncharacterized protein n=1 Tax=Kwoniella europaea PYCC6329 TaxID=1423913 RepID=A0AAX4KQ65_9TREE